jgi:hypothetical protein
MDYKAILKAFLKRNKASREVAAKKEGWSSADDYIKHLHVLAGATPKAAKKTPVKVKVQSAAEILAAPVAGKNSKKHTVHNVHILDASGSMDSGGKFKNALLGINQEVEALKADKAVNYTQTIVDFSYSQDIKIHYWKENLDNVKQLRGTTRGSTALNETIGFVLSKLLGETKKTDKVLVKIFTDGGENDSKGKYASNNAVAKLIEECEGKGFTITFVGTDYDTKQVINKLKIRESNTLVHDNTGAGVTRSFTKSIQATTMYSAKLQAGEDVLDGFYKETGEL